MLRDAAQGNEGTGRQLLLHVLAYDTLGVQGVLQDHPSVSGIRYTGRSRGTSGSPLLIGHPIYWTVKGYFRITHPDLASDILGGQRVLQDYPSWSGIRYAGQSRGTSGSPLLVWHPIYWTVKGYFRVTPPDRASDILGGQRYFRITHPDSNISS